MQSLSQSKTPDSTTSTQSTPTKPYRWPFLFSYYYCLDGLGSDRKREQLAAVLNDARINILIDSGGFSAKSRGEEIDLDDYMQFLFDWKHRFVGYMALDKVGDPIETAKRLKIMQKEGLKPIPIHVLGDDQKRLDELFEMSDWVALAGLRRPHRGMAPKEYVQAKHQWAAGRQVHWLGYSKDSMLRYLQPYSCDTASWASGEMYGRCTIYLGRGEWREYNYAELSQKKSLDTRVVNWLKERRLPLNVEEFADFFYWHKHHKTHGTPYTKFIGAINMWSWMEYTKEFEEFFKTKIFLAAQPMNDYMKHAIHYFEANHL